MKFKIEPPSVPDIDIVLTLSRAEFLSLWRIVGHMTGELESRPMTQESGKFVIVPAKVGTMFDALSTAAKAAGL